MISITRAIAISAAIVVTVGTLAMVPTSAEASTASDVSKVFTTLNQFRSFGGAPDLLRNRFIDALAQQLASGISQHGASHLGDIVPTVQLPGTPVLVVQAPAKVKSSTKNLHDRVGNILGGGTLDQIEVAAYNYAGVGWVKKGSYVYAVIILVQYASTPLDEMFAGHVTLSGSARVGATLTAHTGTFDPVPQVLFYAWTSEGVSVGTNSPTYTLTPSDLGHIIKVSITGTSPGYVSATGTSKPTSDVGRGTIKPPTLRVIGLREVGKQLTVTPTGSWVPLSVLDIEWYRDGKHISGVDGTKYTQSAADLGHKVDARITANANGYNTLVVKLTTATKTERAWTTVPALAPVTPSGPYTVGETVKVATMTWAPTPSSFTYQWFRDGGKISGATHSSYKFTSKDAGKNINVDVTAHRSGYSARLISSLVMLPTP